MEWMRRLLHPARTEMEFMEAVVVAEREGRSRAAVRICARGLERFPEDYYLLMKRLAQARAAGDKVLGKALLERAAAHCPETAATFTSVGEEYAFLGEMQRAEGFFRRALDRASSNGLIREKLAMALVQQRRMEEGVQELTKAVDAEPENRERENLLLKVLLAAEQYSDVVARLAAAPQESLSWDSLMCLSIARAHLDGAHATAQKLLHPEAIPGAESPTLPP